MGPNDCLTDADLDRYHAGELDEAASEHVQRHLAQCPRCAQRDSDLAAQQENLLQQARALETQIATATAAVPDASWVAHAQTFLFADPQSGYQILHKIHQGGQGVIFQAIQKSTRRKVAIKVMRAGPLASEDDKARFEREVEILGQLNHPHIVAIHDSGMVAGYFYYVMDYISGQSFGDYIAPDGNAEPGPKSAPLTRSKLTLSQEELLRLFVKICRAVHAAHMRGITHRDLKPGNILIDDDGEPHVLDFGMAKVVLGGLTDGPTPRPMTITGQFIGSVPWASPEQAEGVPAKIDMRTDVYALGVMLYQILTCGKFPYEVVGNIRDVLDRILQSEPIKLSKLNRRIDTDLETIVLKCLNKDRARRYPNAGELADDLEHYLHGRPITARRDSVVYVLKTRGRTFLRRHPVLTCTLCVLLATFCAHTLGVSLVFNWTPLNLMMERFLTRVAPPASALQTFENVRVVFLSQETQQRLPDVAARAGLTDIQPDLPQSWRRLYGRLMERLAEASPRAVVWDMHFSALPPNLDAASIQQWNEWTTDFVRGVRALNQKGIDVVTATADWNMGETNPNAVTTIPPVHPAIRKATRLGSTKGNYNEKTPWFIEFVLQRGSLDLRPSLALTAIQAFHCPSARLRLYLDSTACWLDVGYENPDADSGILHRWLAPQSNFRLTTIKSITAPQEDEEDLLPNDLLGILQIDLPPDEVLNRATLDFEALLAAEPVQIRDWVDHKLVFLGRFDPKDIGRHPSGRQMNRCYAHACAIESLLQQRLIRRPQNETFLLALGGAVLGLLTALSAANQHVRRFFILIGLTALLVLASIAAYRGGDYFCNPAVPILAMLLASELVAAARRAGRI